MAKKANNQLDFVQGDAQLLSFKSSSFDLVATFEYLPKSERFVVELWRVLKPQSIVIVVAVAKTLIRPLHDLLHSETKTHVNLRKPIMTLRIFKKYLVTAYIIVFTRSFLPIPPHLLNNYFVIYNVPAFLADDYILVTWCKRK